MFTFDLFYKNARTKDGLGRLCKKCDNERTNLYRKNNLEIGRNLSRKYRELHPDKVKESARKAVKKWYLNNKEKVRAHKKVFKAIKSGKLKRENCFCGEKAQAHHEDYGKPLEIMWLCHLHHKQRHALLDSKQVNML